MPRKWDMSEVTKMLSPEGRVRVIWDHVWKGDTLLIIFDKPVVKQKVEYVLYRRGRDIYYGLRNQEESKLERTWDENPAVYDILYEAIAHGARFVAKSFSGNSPDVEL